MSCFIECFIDHALLSLSLRSISDDSSTDSNDPSPKRQMRESSVPIEELSDASVVEKKRIAEAKLWSRKIGAGSLGASWMKTLVPEFKKQYFIEVNKSGRK